MFVLSIVFLLRRYAKILIAKNVFVGLFDKIRAFEGCAQQVGKIKCNKKKEIDNFFRIYNIGESIKHLFLHCFLNF